MTESTTHEIVLTRHREGVAEPASAHLEVRAAARPGLADGQVRVANSHLGLAAVYGDLMDPTVPLPMPPFAVGEPLWGMAVGTVVESRSDDVPEGTVVQHMEGMRAETVLDAGAVFPVPEGVAPEHLLNQGVTAYHGVVDVAQVREGDVVFVTGAAGGVGSLAGQIAKLRGAAMVIGSAGSAEKGRRLVDELGFDAFIDYKGEDVEARLRELAPDGIDVLYDNVGGTQFEAAVRCAADEARFALCGALAAQTGGPDGHPRLDVLQAILHDITIRPFRTVHSPEQITAWNEALSEWLPAGRLTFSQTIVEGDLQTAVATLDELLEGRHSGQVIVALR